MRGGITVLRSSKFKLGHLHFQICPIVHNVALWNGDESGLVKNSPHVDFLRIYIKTGKVVLKNLNSTRYCKMYEYWDELKYGSLPPRTPAYIMKKSTNFISTFESIRKKGFNKKNVIQIMGDPLWLTRGFEAGYTLVGPEIFHGHHRIASLYVLGSEKIKAQLCVDAMPGSRKWVQKMDRMGDIKW